MRACALLFSLALVVPLSLGAQDDSRLRISVIGQAAIVRTARYLTIPPERDVALRGLDAEYWLHPRVRFRAGLASREGFGLAMRAHQSSRPNDLRYLDLSVLYGLGRGIERLAGATVRDAIGDLSAEVAYGGQAGYEQATGEMHGELHRFARIGLRSSSRIAPTPLSLEMRISRLVSTTGLPDGANSMSGLDAETGLRWSFTRWPVDAALGYRFGRFRVYRTSQEVSALRLEAAWRGLR